MEFVASLRSDTGIRRHYVARIMTTSKTNNIISLLSKEESKEVSVPHWISTLHF